MVHLTIKEIQLKAIHPYMTNNNIEIVTSEDLIKLVGIFEHKYDQKLIQRFESQSYIKEAIADDSFLRNTFYPEFRDLMFLGKEKSSLVIYSKQGSSNLIFQKGNSSNLIEVHAELGEIELFLSPNGLHFFSLRLIPLKKDLGAISDLMYCARNFVSEMVHNDTSQSWVSWIEQNILDGIDISTKGAKTIKVDEYSGSKFKLFSVFDIAESTYNIDPETRENLLYDLGCVSPIGTAGGNAFFTPNDAYFNSLLENKIAVFKNYTVLPLFDTFTSLGHSILTSENPGSKRNMFLTWHQTYFRIYLFNLFIKYSLFRYNHEMGDDSVKVRDEFESFLNTYNLSHISYNFLPNLIFHQHRKGLQIDEELEKFQERINRISQAIQEEQQKRSNLLLGLVGAMTSIAGLQPVIEYLEIGRKTVGLGYFSYYPIVLVLALILAVPLLAYLFPEKKKKMLRKWKQRKS